MIFVDCYNKNVYIGEDLVGYINHKGVIYINGKRFAELTAEGEIYLEGTYLAGYIDEAGDIYLNNKKVGILKANNDLYFSKKALG
ncbi:MAG: hypothetical protein IJ186_00510 [Bacilli bacterium]|jgi:hypothetical protein|nr:hypothetical protein [Bacilli bacterium]